MTDETIFANALEKPDAAQRAVYLDAVCKDDPDQRKRIDGLLTAHEKAVGFLERPAVAPAEPEHAPTRAFHARGAAVGDGPTRTHGEDTEEDTQDALAFLQAPGRPDSIGRIGHYEVLEVLGRGAFGIVYRAFDEKLHRVVAVKVLSPSMAATSPARKRFLREAQSSAKVRHQNVVFIHETGEEPLPYLVMEFVPGETLQQRLDRKGPLDVAEVVRIGRQIAEGLAAAHEQGLIHRDIKPSNILIDSGPHQVKITDFGLARAADDASLTRSGVVAGTPMYMAPEQAKGETLDHRADLFSLGSVLYALLTGHPPFRAETMLAVLKRVAEDTPRPMREVIPEVPEWLCRIVEKLHAKNPAERYQSAKEVAEVLADCEKQLQTHRELKDFGRIPEARPTPAPARARVPAWVIVVPCAAVVVLASVSLAFPNMDQLRAFVVVLLVLTPVAVMIAVLRRSEARTEAQQQERRRLLAGVSGLVLGIALPLMVLAGVAFVAFNQTAYLFVTNRGQLILEDMAPEMEVSIVQGGTVLHERSTQKSFELPTNPATEIRVFARGGSEIWRKDFAVKRGDRVTINLAEEQAAVEAIARASVRNNLKDIGKAVHDFASEMEGFVPLFNGKDLTGWKAFPEDRAGSWKVENGVLIGSGNPSHLFTERGNFGNFHLRMETRVKKVGPKAGAVGVFARVPFEDPGMIISPHGREALYRIPVPKLYDPKAAPPDPAPPTYREEPLVVCGVDLKGDKTNIRKFPADEWFTLEIIMDEKNVSVQTQHSKESSSSFIFAGARTADGHIALQLFDDWSVVEFRKIEIKELPSTPRTPEQIAGEEAAMLNGEWIVRGGRLDGQPLADGDIAGMKLHLKDGKFTLPARDESGTPFALTGSYAIDAEKKQLTFTFNLPGPSLPVPCGYRVDGDTLALDFPELKGSGGEPTTGSPGVFAPHRLVASQNNLRVLGVAMQNYMLATNALPPAAITDPKAKDGKPLLSWRVALLPYIGEDRLYKEFKLDESWDSEHNKKLIPKMPRFYATPDTAAPFGHTHYQVFVGPGTAFEPRRGRTQGLGALDFKDDLSKTILVVEAAEAVAWTKPDDLPYDPKKPLPKLGAFPGATQVVLGGGVWRLSPQATEEVIRRAIERDNGNAIPDQDFRPIPASGSAIQLAYRRVAPPQVVTALDREDLAKLKGEWLVRFAEKDGESLAQKNIDALVIRLGDGEFEIRQPGMTSQKEIGTFRVDAANKQLFLNFKQSLVPVRCGYHLDGDRLRLTFSSWDGKKYVQAADLATLRDRSRTINNLKQLAIAMHIYNDTFGGFPRVALTNPKAKDGKALLSWRVAILPYIEQGELYKQFKLDEPWDSPNNKKLIDKMPRIFSPPAGDSAEPGLTHLRVFTGPGTPFEAIPNRDFGVQLTEIADGTAGTLLIVEAAEPVIWTKPDDLPYDPKQPLPKLGATKVGIPVAMCDGSIGTLAPDISEKVMRALVTRNGNEIVSASFLKPDPHQTPPMYMECVRRTRTPPAAPPKFDDTKAKSLQDTWAKHLGVPVEFENAVGMKFRLIPRGEFTMGSTAKEIEELVKNPEFKDRTWEQDRIRGEGPDRRVEVVEPFYLGVHEVTVGQFRQFAVVKKYKTVAEKTGGGWAWDAKTELWGQSPSHVWSDSEFVGSESHPVSFITLADAKAFCAWLGEQDGRWYVVPTEEQWEFACRAGTATRWSFGDDPAAMKSHGWTMPHSGGKHNQVGRLTANPFGLCDMYGNARELTVGEKEEPIGRGFDARSSPLEARSAARFALAKPGQAFHLDGFRVAIVGDLKAKPVVAKPQTEAVLLPLREAVKAKKDTLELTKARHEAGRVSKIELRQAEAEWTDSRVALADAEGDKPAVVARLEELVKYRQEERDLIAERVKAGVDRPEVLNQADGRLTDAKVRLAKVKPNAAREVAPAPRLVARLLRKFDPVANETIASAQRDRTGWIFRVPTEGKPLRLYEIPNPQMDTGGVLVFRTKMSTAFLTLAYPEIVCRYPDGTETRSVAPKVVVEGTTNEAAYEFRCPLKPDARPDLIRLNLVLKSEDGGHAYFKEMELWHLPAEQLHGRLASPTTVPRKFDPASDASITFGRYRDASGWFFDFKPGQQTIRLYELENPATDEAATLVLRGRLGTYSSKGAFLQIVCCFPDGTEAVSAEPEVLAEGDTNPTSYEVRYALKPGEKPYLIRVNLVVKKSDKDQSVYLKELELSQTPAANPKK